MSSDKFDLDIDLLREWDSEIDETVEEFMPLALEFTAKGPIPKTCSVFLSFIASTEFIKNGILDHAEAENAYAAKILFRSLIEHDWRFQYIWFRASEEKTDAAAEDYLKHGMFKESLQLARSWKRVAKILGRDSRLTAHDAMRSVIEATAAYSNKEIDEQSSQFEYARIIEHIFKKMKRREREEVPFLLKILPTYSDLSCFVHGSPGAMNIMGSLQAKGELAADLLNTAALAFQTAGGVKLFSLLTFCQYDTKFSRPYLKVDKLLRLVNRPSQPAE